MRVIGIDVGQRRIGLAISDPSGTLARPLSVIEIRNATEGVARVAEAISQLAAEDDGLAAIVVGRPARLDGSESPEGARVDGFVRALGARTPLPIVREDERLTSRE